MCSVVAGYVPWMFWLDYVPGLIWLCYVPGLIWLGYVPGMFWPDYVPELICLGYIPGMFSPGYFPGMFSPGHVVWIFWPGYVPGLYSTGLGTCGLLLRLRHWDALGGLRTWGILAGQLLVHTWSICNCCVLTRYVPRLDLPAMYLEYTCWQITWVLFWGTVRIQVLTWGIHWVYIQVSSFHILTWDKLA